MRINKYLKVLLPLSIVSGITYLVYKPFNVCATSYCFNNNKEIFRYLRSVNEKELKRVLSNVKYHLENYEELPSFLKNKFEKIDIDVNKLELSYCSLSPETIKLIRNCSNNQLKSITIYGSINGCNNVNTLKELNNCYPELKFDIVSLDYISDPETFNYLISKIKNQESKEYYLGSSGICTDQKMIDYFKNMNLLKYLDLNNKEEILFTYDEFYDDIIGFLKDKKVKIPFDIEDSSKFDKQLKKLANDGIKFDMSRIYMTQRQTRFKNSTGKFVDAMINEKVLKTFLDNVKLDDEEKNKLLYYAYKDVYNNDYKKEKLESVLEKYNMKCIDPSKLTLDGLTLEEYFLEMSRRNYGEEHYEDFYIGLYSGSGSYSNSHGSFCSFLGNK